MQEKTLTELLESKLEALNKEECMQVKIRNAHLDLQRMKNAFDVCDGKLNCAIR